MLWRHFWCNIIVDLGCFINKVYFQKKIQYIHLGPGGNAEFSFLFINPSFPSIFFHRCPSYPSSSSFSSSFSFVRPPPPYAKEEEKRGFDAEFRVSHDRESGSDGRTVSEKNIHICFCNGDLIPKFARPAE